MFLLNFPRKVKITNKLTLSLLGNSDFNFASVDSLNPHENGAKLIAISSLLRWLYTLSSVFVSSNMYFS